VSTAARGISHELSLAETLDAYISQQVNLALAKLEERVRPKWQGEKQAAAYCQMPHKALGNARRRGKVEGRWNGTEYVYATAELDRFLESLAEAQVTLTWTPAGPIFVFQVKCPGSADTLRGRTRKGEFRVST